MVLMPPAFFNLSKVYIDMVPYAPPSTAPAFLFPLIKWVHITPASYAARVVYCFTRRPGGFGKMKKFLAKLKFSIFQRAEREAAEAVQCLNDTKNAKAVADAMVVQSILLYGATDTALKVYQYKGIDPFDSAAVMKYLKERTIFERPLFKCCELFDTPTQMRQVPKRQDNIPQVVAELYWHGIKYLFVPNDSSVPYLAPLGWSKRISAARLYDGLLILYELPAFQGVIFYLWGPTPPTGIPMEYDILKDFGCDNFAQSIKQV